MKRRVPSSPWLYLPFLSIFLCPSCTREGGTASVPKLLDPGSKEVLGYIAIPSLGKILEDASAVGDLFAPGKTTP